MNYQVSAIGLSWESLAETMKLQAQREKDLQNLYKDTTSASLSMTQTNSQQAYLEYYDQAQSQLMDGISGVVGAVVGAGVSVGCFALEAKYGKAAMEEENVTTNSMGIEKVDSNNNSLELTEIKPQQGTAKLQGQVVQEKAVETNSPASKTSPDKPKTSPKAEEYRRKQQMIQQQGQNFSSLSNQALQAGGKFVSTPWLTKAADAKRQEAVAQGVGATLGAQAQAQTSAVASTDTQMNSTESLFTTIIQVSAVRG